MTLRHKLKRALCKIGYRKQPDFLIIGAQKAGTTYLYSLLSQHHQIRRPAFKEAHFFDYDWNFERGPWFYGLNFPLPYSFRDQLAFEATPDYLYFEKCVRRISELLPDVRLIILLREPVSRAFSAWKMHHLLFRDHPKYAWLHDPRSFEEAIEEEMKNLNNQEDIFSYLSRGIYSKQIANYLKYFPRENVLVRESNDLLKNTDKVVKEVTDFLNLELLDWNLLNESDMFWDNKGSESLKLNESMKKELSIFYRPYNEELQELLDIKLDW